MLSEAISDERLFYYYAVYCFVTANIINNAEEKI